jgi:hypothetical protein
MTASQRGPASPKIPRLSGISDRSITTRDRSPSDHLSIGLGVRIATRRIGYFFETKSNLTSEYDNLIIVGMSAGEGETGVRLDQCGRPS